MSLPLGRFFDKYVRVAEGPPKRHGLLRPGGGGLLLGERPIEVVPVGTHLATLPGVRGDPGDKVGYYGSQILETKS